MAAEMSEIDRMDGRVQTLSGEISKKISELRAADTDARLTEIGDSIRDKLRRVKDSLRRMREAAKDVTPKQRRAVLETIERYEADVRTQERDFQRELDAASRSSLMGGGLTDEEREKRALLRTTGERVDRTGARLKAALTTVNDTETIGVGIVDTMVDQGVRLEKARETVRETKALTGDAKSTLLRMEGRIWTNKLLLILVIIALLAANGVSIWYFFLR